MTSTFETVRTTIVDKLEVEPGQVSLQSTLRDDLGGDSLEIVDLTMALEDAFDVVVTDDELDGLQTVGDAVKLIDRKLSQPAAAE